MPLRKTTGNMYEFITHIWNPVKGRCGYDCSYCYVKRIAKRFGKKQHDLSIDMEGLNANLGSENYIFVCSTRDLFFSSGDLKRHHLEILNITIGKMLERAKLFPGNKYLWHTKNPARALEFQSLFGDNDMLCVTVETNRWQHDTPITKAPHPAKRFNALREWKKPWMLTIEPVMDFDLKDFIALIGATGNMPIQVNIGADSGRNNLPEPSPEKLRALIDWLEPRTKAHLKKNLGRLLPR